MVETMLLRKIEAGFMIVMAIFICLFMFMTVHNYIHNENDTSIQDKLAQRVTVLESKCGVK